MLGRSSWCRGLVFCYPISFAHTLLIALIVKVSLLIRCAVVIFFEIQGFNKDDFGNVLNKIRIMRDNLNKAISAVKDNSAITEKALQDVITLSGNIANKVNECEGKSITVSAALEEMLSTTQDIAKNCEDASHFIHVH